MSTGIGQTDAVVGKHVLVSVSQQAVPWLVAGQLFWQSLSVAQLGAQTFARSGGSDASATMKLPRSFATGTGAPLPPHAVSAAAAANSQAVTNDAFLLVVTS